MPLPSSAFLDGADALIVDWDGTVVDNTALRLHALRQALAPHGIDLPDDRYRALSGLPVRHLIRALTDAADLPVDDIVLTSRGILLNGPAPEPIEATLDLLHEAHRRGLPRAVASSAAGVLVHRAITQLGLGQLLPVVVTAEDVTRGKPAADAYLEAACRLDRAPTRCLAVDDAPDGITAARAAGMRVLTLRADRLVPAP